MLAVTTISFMINCNIYLSMQVKKVMAHLRLSHRYSVHGSSVPLLPGTLHLHWWPTNGGLLWIELLTQELAGVGVGTKWYNDA